MSSPTPAVPPRVWAVLYGNRAFLVGRSARGTEYQLWRLANISAPAVTGEPFTRDAAFDLQRFARRSFGTFQEQPVAVVLRFTAGAIKEICWYLVTWGAAVTVEQPACLRRRLTEMCASSPPTMARHREPLETRKEHFVTEIAPPEHLKRFSCMRPMRPWIGSRYRDRPRYHIRGLLNCVFR